MIPPSSSFSSSSSSSSSGPCTPRHPTPKNPHREVLLIGETVGRGRPHPRTSSGRSGRSIDFKGLTPKRGTDPDPLEFTSLQSGQMTRLQIRVRRTLDHYLQHTDAGTRTNFNQLRSLVAAQIQASDRVRWIDRDPSFAALVRLNLTKNLGACSPNLVFDDFCTAVGLYQHWAAQALPDNARWARDHLELCKQLTVHMQACFQILVDQEFALDGVQFADHHSLLGCIGSMQADCRQALDEFDSLTGSSKTAQQYQQVQRQLHGTLCLHPLLARVHRCEDIEIQTTLAPAFSMVRQHLDRSSIRFRLDNPRVAAAIVKRIGSCGSIDRVFVDLYEHTRQVMVLCTKWPQDLHMGLENLQLILQNLDVIEEALQCLFAQQAQVAHLTFSDQHLAEPGPELERLRVSIVRAIDTIEQLILS